MSLLICSICLLHACVHVDVFRVYVILVVIVCLTQTKHLYGNLGNRMIKDSDPECINIFEEKVVRNSLEVEVNFVSLI